MIYDISQSLPDCTLYPGDYIPRVELLHSMDKGELYNQSILTASVHSGTHVDAPKHFFKDGNGVESIPLDKVIGSCYVETHHGNVTEEDARRILKNAGGISRILIGGDAVITLDAAKVFAEAEIDLIGNQSQTIGPLNAPMAVHKVLLEKEIVLLEGIRLGHVPDGIYILNCAPLKITGADGSPCRAVLISNE